MRFNYISYKEKRLDKFSKYEQEDLIFDLINAFTLVNNPLDSALLLQDLLTEDEVKDLSKRLRIARLLLDGTTHREIADQLHCSLATVTKIKIWLENAGQGLIKVIKKLPKRRKVNIPKRMPGVGYGLPSIIDYYISAGLKAKETKRLENFTKSMKTKTALDKELREEISSDFRRSKKSRY